MPRRSARPGRRPDGRARPGSSRFGYHALGPDAPALAQSHLSDCYGFLGDFASRVVSGAATTEAAVRDQVAPFTDAGCDELILFPCSPEIDQLNRLAAVTLG